MANLHALVELIALRLQRKPSSEWLAALAAVGVPAGPVLTIAEMLEHPQVLARDMVVETMHPKAGKVRAIGCPLKLSATPARVSRAAPLFGQHTREVTRAGRTDSRGDRRRLSGPGGDSEPGLEAEVDAHGGHRIASQVELDVAIVDRSTIHPGDAEKSDVQRVFVGADLRHARQVVRER